MGRKLYVGNLPYEIGETELQDLFARAGQVETISVMRDAATGRARGFAFVEMSTSEEAERAITELNDTQLGGRNLTVNEARPPGERTGGGGGAKNGTAGAGGFGGGGGGDGSVQSEARAAPPLTGRPVLWRCWASVSQRSRARRKKASGSVPMAAVLTGAFSGPNRNTKRS